MTTTILDAPDEAVLNAAGEIFLRMNLKGSVSFDPDFLDKPYFSFIAKVAPLDAYASGSGESLAAAVRQYQRRADELRANPPEKKLSKPNEVRDAALALVADMKRDHPDYDGPAIDDLAEKISALPVKE